MNPVILSKVLILISKSTFDEVDKILRTNFIKTDEIYSLIKEYYILYHSNKNDNLPLSIPLRIQGLYTNDNKIKNFIDVIK